MNRKTRTLDGERTPVSALNLGEAALDASRPVGFTGRLRRWSRNLSLVMAGMYTGLTCYGTPNTHHEYDESSDEKPDRRPI